MIKQILLRIEYAFHRLDAYLAAYREDGQVYKDAMDKASQCEFKIKWG